MVRHILSIAGTDPTGGAGLQADLKTVSALGAYAFTVCTAVVAQNTRGVRNSTALDPIFVKDQLDAVFEDTHIDAIKIGMIGTQSIVEMIADRLRHYQAKTVVYDPVIHASSGHTLVSHSALDTIRNQLLPLCTVITPNLAESALLSNCAIATSLQDMFDQARRLLRHNSQWILIKGGHLNEISTSSDLLHSGDETWLLQTQRIPSVTTHGTGCTLSAAVATYLPDFDVLTSVRKGKNFVYHAIASHDYLHVGKGRKPLNHFYRQMQDARLRPQSDESVEYWTYFPTKD